MINDLKGMRRVLTQWEYEFVENLAHLPFKTDLSTEQAKKLQQIHSERSM
jgi:hypothetical protein